MPPLGANALTLEEQAACVAASDVLAQLDARAARELVNQLPPIACRLSGRARAALLALIAALDAPALCALAASAPAAAASLFELSEEQCASSLAALAQVAARFPQAAVAGLLQLPRLHRHASAAQVARFFALGSSIPADKAAAATAFFGLRSRSGVEALFAAASVVRLEPELGVWRKLIEMISGEPAVIRRVAEPSLRPGLELDPALGAVELPELCDWLPSRQENRAVLRFVALQLAGRRQFGTYAPASGEAVGPLARLRQAGAYASVLEQLFLVAEGVRVQAQLGAHYPGTRAQTRRLARRLLELWNGRDAPDFARTCDLLLAAALAGDDAPLPRALSAERAAQLSRVLQPLRAADASVQRSIAAARQLARWLASTDLVGDSRLSAAVAALAIQAEQTLPARGLAAAQTAGAALTAASLESLDCALAADSGGSGARLPAPAAELLDDADAASDMTDAGAAAAGADWHPDQRQLPPALQRRRVASVQSFVYDEWDHTISDYRAGHCRVHELELPSDRGVFFERTLADACGLLAQVRRQFEQMRPERYRPLFGLEDGEDFDLNALTDARIEARGGRTPSSRVYTSRTRQARDVATLFLLDMSASTEQPYPEPHLPPPRRIIDTLKEALVVMSAALENLGDQYAIYGFTSRGRDQVEVYPVKGFREALDHSVRARIGGIEPKSGTRMGAALRHMLSKFAGVSARSKHLILLSDGFPQDHDYGDDRRSHAYGIQDTAMALRELSAAGPVPFCITVDRSGNDYLRMMCDETQYLIIHDLDHLPRELPKIYRRVARG